MLQTARSTGPEARATIDQMDRRNVEMFNSLLEGVALEDIANITFGLNAALSNALAGVLNGMLTLDESLDRVEWVARVLLTASQRGLRSQRGSAQPGRECSCDRQ